MATVTEVIAAGRRDILSLEPDILADLLRAYDDAWRFSERQIGRYEAQIADAIAQGVEPRPSWLRQQTWYRQLQASIDAEMSRFQSEALRTIAYGQRQAVGIAAQTAVGFTGAVGISPGIVARVNAGAFERWVSALRPDSPLRGVFGRYGVRMQEMVLDRITVGIGTGQGVSTIVNGTLKDFRSIFADSNAKKADITAWLDTERARLHTSVRTEVLRSYRGSSRESFEAMGPDVVSEWEWTASKSLRTCPSCLAYDGRRFPFNEYPDRFHPACRCVIRPVPSARLIPPRGRPRETGEAWFARQPEVDQRKVLSPGHFELYQQGTPLSDMVTVRTSPTWGESLQVKPLHELRRA